MVSDIGCMGYYLLPSHVSDSSNFWKVWCVQAYDLKV